MAAINTLPHPFYRTRCRHHLKGCQSPSPAKGSCFLRMSKRLLLRNEWMPPLGTQKFGFIYLFSPAACSAVAAEDAVLEGTVETSVCSGLSSLLLGNHLKMMTQLFSNCQVWVLCGNGECSSLIPAFLLVSLCGWKNGQECKWFKFSYVLEKQNEAIYLSDAVNIQFYVWCPHEFFSQYRYLHSFS